MAEPKIVSVIDRARYITAMLSDRLRQYLRDCAHTDDVSVQEVIVDSNDPNAALECSISVTFKVHPNAIKSSV